MMIKADRLQPSHRHERPDRLALRDIATTLMWREGLAVDPVKDLAQLAEERAELEAQGGTVWTQYAKAHYACFDHSREVPFELGRRMPGSFETGRRR